MPRHYFRVRSSTSSTIKPGPYVYVPSQVTAHARDLFTRCRVDFRGSRWNDASPAASAGDAMVDGALGFAVAGPIGAAWMAGSRLDRKLLTVMLADGESITIDASSSMVAALEAARAAGFQKHRRRLDELPTFVVVCGLSAVVALTILVTISLAT